MLPRTAGIFGLSSYLKAAFAGETPASPDDKMPRGCGGLWLVFEGVDCKWLIEAYRHLRIS